MEQHSDPEDLYADNILNDALHQIDPARATTPLAEPLAESHAEPHADPSIEDFVQACQGDITSTTAVISPLQSPVRLRAVARAGEEERPPAPRTPPRARASLASSDDLGLSQTPTSPSPERDLSTSQTPVGLNFI